MPQIFAARWAVAVMLAGALAASPADAQGKGKEKRNERERPELVRREDYKEREKALKEEYKRREERLKREYERRSEVLKRDRDRWEDDDDRWEDRRERRSDEAGPPFCRNGQGHPVHGRRWCEEKGYGLGRNVGRYDDRYGNDRYGNDRRTDERYGSYAQEHQEFHRWLDRKYSDRAAQRPLDIQWQLRIRAEKRAEHDRWHDRMGRRHD